MIDRSCLFRYDTDTGVYSCLRLHTGTDYRCFRHQKRYGLTLHVGSHQGTVCIIVLQKRDQRGCHREYHLRRHIHVIEHRLGILLRLLFVTSGNAVLHEMSFRIKRLVRLRYMIIILFVRRHVYHFISDTRILRV